MRSSISRPVIDGLPDSLGVEGVWRVGRDRFAAAHAKSLSAGPDCVLRYRPRVALGHGTTVAAEAVVHWPAGSRARARRASATDALAPAGEAPSMPPWLLDAACAQARSWAEGVVCVQVSARQVAEIARAVERSGLPPERCEVAIHESAMMEADEDKVLALCALRDAGIGVALDAFGARHASLASLRRLPLTAVRLDRELSRHVPADQADAAMLRAIVEFAHALDLAVVATDVAGEAQRGFLAAIGCDQAQGPLFGAADAPERLPFAIAPTG